MFGVNFGTTKGATVARRDGIDPLAIVKEIMRKNPQASVERICTLTWDRVSDDQREAEAFVRYLARNLFNQLYQEERGTKNPPPPRPTVTAEQREAERKSTREKTAKVVSNIKQIVLMELPTPFGKPLGDCNGQEGRQLAGWQAAVFQGVGDKKRLRDVKSESDLREAFATI